MSIFGCLNKKNICTWLFLILVQFPLVASAAVSENLACEILVYINQYRAQQGLPKLIMNSSLTKEAYIHSLDMAKHKIPFGHDGFSNRLARLNRQIPNSLAGAENVAYNYKTAKIVSEGWIKSSGHRQNIKGNYTVTGIGIAEDKQGKLYYTQMFLKVDDGKNSKKSKSSVTWLNKIGSKLKI